ALLAPGLPPEEDRLQSGPGPAGGLTPSTSPSARRLILGQRSPTPPACPEPGSKKGTARGPGRLPTYARQRLDPARGTDGTRPVRGLELPRPGRVCLRPTG